MKIFFLTLLLSFNTFAFDHTHSELDKLLKGTVSFKGKQSYVDYKKIKKDPKALDAYLGSLSAVSKKEFDKWGAPDRLAFLINTYNAFTLKLIVNGYPTKSIKDLGSFLSSPWKKKFFKLFGKETHLDNVEHDMIRKDFNEPRIHFAVVCASIGCPPLLDFAFTGKKIENQFQKATAFFLGDKAKNSYDPKKKKLRLSKIFKWYGDDFKERHGSYVNFVAPYFSIKNPKDVSVSWNSYDWGLNEKK